MRIKSNSNRRYFNEVILSLDKRSLYELKLILHRVQICSKTQHKTPVREIGVFQLESWIISRGSHTGIRCAA